MIYDVNCPLIFSYLGEETEQQYISSKRSSIDGAATTHQLEQLTLATYSLFTASALLPTDDEGTGSAKSKDSARGSSTKTTPTQGQGSRDGNCSGKMHTPIHTYVNGALEEDEISDVSL